MANKKYVLFVDAGDYERTKDPEEIYIRAERDGEIFDLCNFSVAECDNPIEYAKGLILAYNYMNKG